jgi:hypothetical protein
MSQHFFDRGRLHRLLQRETNIWIKVILHTYAQKNEVVGRMGERPERCQLYFHLHILFCFLFHFNSASSRIFLLRKNQVNFSAIDLALGILRRKTLYKACI